MGGMGDEGISARNSNSPAFDDQSRYENEPTYNIYMERQFSL